MDYAKKLALRVAIAILLGVFFDVFYTVFSPLTLFLSKATLNLLGYTAVIGAKDLLIVEGMHLRFVEACTAASAYYLLALLVILTRGISWKRMILMFVTGSLMVLAMNTLRIDILFHILFNYGVGWFEYTHMLFWKVVSTLFVAATWIFLIRLFKVEGIPVYSDFRQLWSLSRGKKPRKKHNKK